MPRIEDEGDFSNAKKGRAMKPKKTEDQTVEVTPISTATINVCLVGTSPMLINRLAEKARNELLMPSPPKNRADRAMRLKHNLPEEYRNSVYTVEGDDVPTRLIFPGAAFRKAMATAALDMPGSSKAQIGRLVKVREYNVHIFGVPKVSCMIVRQAGINRTPDVRTRAILPEWACRITIRFAHPLLREKAVLNLLAAAGDFIGVGDGRNEKGALSFGCFEICGEKDPRFLRACFQGGVEEQDAALADPQPFDLESRRTMEYFYKKLEERDIASRSPGNGDGNGKPRKKKEVLS